MSTQCHHRPRRCLGKPLRRRVLCQASRRSPLSFTLHAGHELPHRHQLRAVYPIRASTPFDAALVSATAAHCLFVRVEHHCSILKLLHDAQCATPPRDTPIELPTSPCCPIHRPRSTSSSIDARLWPATSALLWTPLPPLPPRGPRQHRHWVTCTGRPGKVVGRVRCANKLRHHCGRGPCRYCATGPRRIWSSDS
jgi:hypothetical protein